MNYITMTLPEQLDDTVTGEAGERSLYAHFQSVTDYRKLRGRRYEAAVVLTLLVLAKITGEKKISGIAHWVKLRGGWLCEKLRAKHGHLPCLNTYRYVLMHIDEEQLDREISAFMAEQCVVEEEGLARTDEEEGEIENKHCLEATNSAAGRAEPAQIVIDGKVLCGTDRRTPSAQAPQLVVSAYHVQQRRVLTQQGALSRGKEKQSALTILEHLPVSGHLVSVDALHTSPNWCRQVRGRQGHYLLIAKRNRRELYEDIALLFTHTPLPALPEQRAQTIDKGHGRLEIRRLRVSSALSDYLKPDWPDVAQVFQVQRLVTRGQCTSQELAYGLTSLSAADVSPAQLLQAIRRHWHIENRLHYRRDVTLGEDACLLAQRPAARILALLNNLVLFLIDHSGGAGNAAAKIREFAAAPQLALDLILLPP